MPADRQHKPTGPLEYPGETKRMMGKVHPTKESSTFPHPRDSAKTI